MNTLIITQYNLTDWYEDDFDEYLLKCFLNDADYSDIFKSWLTHYGQRAHKIITKHIKKVTKNYYYMVTFTLKAESQYDDAKKYVYRQHKRPKLPITRYSVVEELTKRGVPHWHCAIKASAPLKKDRFSQYSKVYGYVDFSRNFSTNYDTMIKYMSKTNIPLQLLPLIQ